MNLFNKNNWDIRKNPKKVILFLFLVLIAYWYYQSSVEQKNLEIDEYNFREGKEFIQTLESVKKDTKDFHSLKEFNEQYKASIQPLENCYYASSNNGDKKYIFGFRLYSKFYRQEYKREYFAYPSYDLPYNRICAGYCYDRNMEKFLRVISNPCEE